MIYLEKLCHNGETAVVGQPLGDAILGWNHNAIDNVDVAITSFLFPAEDGSALDTGSKRCGVEEWHLLNIIKHI